eukprot:m51a1_g8244 putative ribosome biogenesis protein bop1 (731) ;mRNA; r:124899-127302
MKGGAEAATAPAQGGAAGKSKPKGKGTPKRTQKRAGDAAAPESIDVAEMERLEQQLASSAQRPEPADDEDSSDDEAANNRVGNIPMSWYDDFEHIGYDVDGNAIAKSADWEKRRDAIERFLAEKDDPDHWRKFYDAVNDREVRLTDADIEVLNSFMSRRLPGGMDPSKEEWITESEHPEAIHPFHDPTPAKAAFQPDKTERKRILSLARHIRKAWIKMDKQIQEGKVPKNKDKKKKRADAPEYGYDIWATPGKVRPGYIPAKPRKRPGHIESYNPPEEYLPREREARPRTKRDHRIIFRPERFRRLRHVPAYRTLVDEAAARCMSLMTAPRRSLALHRKRRERITSPEALLPRLPDVRDLRPFPDSVGIVYRGHGGGVRVRAVSCDPRGQWLASGGSDGSLRIWEVDTGRCHAVIALGGPIRAAAWCPNPDRKVLAVSAGGRLFFVVCEAACGPASEAETARGCLRRTAAGARAGKGKSAPGVTWREVTTGEPTGVAMVINHEHEVADIAWHRRGDYVAVVTQADPDSPSADTAVTVHRLSQHHSQRLRVTPRAGPVMRVAWHPTKPGMFVATQRSVRVYDLTAHGGRLEQRLTPGGSARWISALAVHPSGDHVLIGNYDRRVCWFDRDLSTRPYKVFHTHSRAVRAVAFHDRYPLLASAGDDGATHIYHAAVKVGDLNSNAEITPVRVLKGAHNIVDDYGVMDIDFHPAQPWLFTAGADGLVILHTDCM